MSTFIDKHKSNHTDHSNRTAYEGHAQTPLTKLAALRNFAILRLRGAQTVTNIFSSCTGISMQSTPRADELFKMLTTILQELEEEVDISWEVKRKELKDA